MLRFEFNMRRVRALRAWHKWFFPAPEAGDARRLTLHYHCRETKKIPGFHREAKFTKLIDLTKSEDELFDDFGKNTKPKVKRALTEGMRFSPESDANVLLQTYNAFSAAKHRPPMDESVLHAYWPRMFATKLMHEGEVLVMHSYLYDPELRRACQMHSASLFRSTDDGARQNLMGRANRLLQYLDMLWLKEKGAHVFDLGGYALHTTDPELIEVNDFKDGFGGQLVEESNYYSLPLYWLRRTKTFVAGFCEPCPASALNPFHASAKVAITKPKPAESDGN